MNQGKRDPEFIDHGEEIILYPVNLKAAGLRALVIGGGHVALRKVKS